MFSLDVKSKDPIYIQLEKNIVRYINLGIYEKNSMLPSVRALACELGINPNTVSKAYKNLEAKGIIYTVAGKGVFVKGTESLKTFNRIAMNEMKSILRDAKNSGVEKEDIIEIVNEVWEGKCND